MLISCRMWSRVVLSAVASLPLICASALAQDCDRPSCRGLYVGFFAGGGGSANTNVNQSGTAFFAVGGPPDGLGPLGVNANGSASGRGTGVAGLQIGREFAGTTFGGDERSWGLRPAGELEAYYLGTNYKGDVLNPNARLPEHDFADTFPMNTGVFLVNAVLNVQTSWQRVTPYIGGGVGTAFVTVAGADSLQIAPPEAGVNHFNSDPSASSWAFAVQAKAGVRYNLTERWWLFGEYRFLYIGSTNFTFGPTVYANHAPTSAWSVHMGDMLQHLGVGGIGFNF